MQILSKPQREQFIRDGYVKVPGLIPPDVTERTRDVLLRQLAIDPRNQTTWTPEKSIPTDLETIALTETCRNEGVEEVVEQIVGDGFVRGYSFSPALERAGVEPPVKLGYIPVLNFPQEGPREFVRPGGYHIDGLHRTTLWPDKFFLVIFAYLTDVAEYGGATVVLPGSHRQVFEYWQRQSHPGSTNPPGNDEIPYAEPVPLPGSAGDVIFMHYLMVHSGSANRSDRIRIGLNTAVYPDPERPYQQKNGSPTADWTPMDFTLRTDTIAG